MSSIKVDQILSSVAQLRPMPTHVSRILRALEDPNTNAGEIADLIGLDQALAASLLKMANSAGLGYNLNCTNLKEAVMRLGYKRIKTLVLGLTATGPLTRRMIGYRLGAGELWNHSVATAVAAQWLAQAVRYPRPEEAYVAGLLHDFGKLLLDQHVLIDYNRMMEIMLRNNRCLWEVEEQVIGIDHARVGGLIAEKWSFPVILTEAIQFHHMPSLAPTAEELASIVNIANAFTSQYESGLTDLFGHIPHPEALRILGIPESRLETLRTTITQYMMVGNTGM
jgi:putative nucleotidyltransferase with HDIG domain